MGRVYGIKPWEVGQVKVKELNAMRADVAELEEASQAPAAAPQSAAEIAAARAEAMRRGQ